MMIIDCNTSETQQSVRGSGTLTYDEDICNRHIQVFGEAMQSRIAQLTIGIGSVGGLGMILLEQLMRLFPAKLVVVDLDHVSKSNLNRLPGSNHIDARLGISKVDLAARHALEFNPCQKIVAVDGNFLEEENQELFRECDVFFSAFDRVGPRLAANQLCLVHGIVLFDCGTGVQVESSAIQAAGGQIIRVTPGSGFCLSCGGFYDKAEAQADFMDSDELALQENMGYVRGANIDAPQVYALNGMVASWAIWFFMRTVAGHELGFDGIAIDALNHSSYTWTEDTAKPNSCPICGDNGLAMTGDKGELLVKNDDKLPILLGGFVFGDLPEAEVSLGTLGGDLEVPRQEVSVSCEAETTSNSSATDGGSQRHIVQLERGFPIPACPGLVIGDNVSRPFCLGLFGVM